MSSLTISFAKSSCKLNGDLTRETVATIANKEVSSAFAEGSLVVDLNNVVRVDSAGLAWLLSLVELAKNSDCTLSITNSPQGLLKLAKLSAVDTFLPID